MKSTVWEINSAVGKINSPTGDIKSGVWQEMGN